jgi:hypothetical protein
MPTIRVEAASAVPWSDVEHSLSGGGDGASCWCQWFLLPRKQFDSESRGELRERFREEVDAPAPAPGLGVAKQLVHAGVEHAAFHGARVVEAYPIDTERRRARANELFVGTVNLFHGQGFVETARPLNARVVMTRTLTPNA